MNFKKMSFLCNLFESKRADKDYTCGNLVNNMTVTRLDFDSCTGFFCVSRSNAIIVTSYLHFLVEFLFVSKNSTLSSGILLLTFTFTCI